jgi:hypothetical protein
MGLHWQSLAAFDQQWWNNVDALRSVNPTLADAVQQHALEAEYVYAMEDTRLHLGTRVNDQIQPLPNPLPLAAASDVSKKLFPTGQCTEPVLVAGLDQGWLWEILYQLPCSTPMAPGHHPPLYFLAREIERFSLILHMRDWTKLLSDPRVRLFVGTDAVEQMKRDMCENAHVPWAKLSVTIDQAIWPAGVSLDSVLQNVHQSANAKFQQLSRQIETMYAGADTKSVIRKMRGEPARIMGITSRFTTFLKFSMQDWLDGFAAMGHETRLVMEQGDHEMTNPLYFAEQVIEFKPDLIVLIDHYRAEMPGLPKQIPSVMWVQDNLPNIFNPKAGASQGRRDYCVGFGRLHLRDQCGYPEQRFMPAQVGVNPARFVPQQLSPEQEKQFACDISFVSHASVPATVLLTEQINRADAMGKKLLIDIFEQMRAVYDGGHAITHASLIGGMIQKSLLRARFNADETTRRTMFDFFTNRINNALFRHQALTWAADLGVNFHLWGRGWENNSRFARYAKGIACNQSQLVSIYQASKINLQLTPTGAVHQRLLDGLAAGGFFLMRYSPGDEVERIYRKLYEWCAANNVTTDDMLRARANNSVRQMLAQIKTLLGVDPFDLAGSFIDVLRLAADGGYIRSAGSIWPEYDRLNFATRGQLESLALYFLQQPNERKQIAASMRQAMIERFSYESISRRLLEFVADDLERDYVPVELAA